MSLFDENKINSSPITAQLLRDILAERRVGWNEDSIIRYNKILQHILNRVRYNTEEEVWEHTTSFAALGLSEAPFEDKYLTELNRMISDGRSVSKICDWVHEHPIKPNLEFKNFVDYFKTRGFQIHFKTADYLKAEDRSQARIIIISWKEDNN